MSSTNPLAAHLVQFAYIPSAVLIGAATLFKKELIPLAIAVAVALTGFQLVTGGTKTPTPAVPAPSQPKTVLKPDEFQEFPITKKTQISHNTAIYRFSLPTEDAILGLPIGQHISLAATLDVKDPKTGEVTTKEVVRSYTPISSDNEKGYFDLIVKSYPTGNISRHLATLNVGDKMKVRGPKGAMVYTPNMARHIGMIAGGTGITPMLQVARAIQRGRKAGDKTKVDLIFANVNPEDILLKDDLDKLAAEDEHFNVYYVLNNPPETWAGGVGFVTGEMIKGRLPPPAKDVKLLLCGPPPMVSAIKKAAESLGYAKARPVSKLEDQVFAF
ncbi:NADH-cytochrome b5 reductase 1 [Fulvia fulva]|uniref:NADH-cytochrome b5 reductase n=1 Tax=Passalora fulva TaxID=5499 RepID=A0A9Q8P9F2_PASFU|nr:NADH-cytochrome b5 reductase 1 [Fulvia fulva]KAK4623863.1 NADH-cytochrome b5 reductase 1 [Fulvia fulva]KAK4625319.1 NADH-cytochrome b5 reductase 1 [Fulvia fulva]UJO17881.1 NADH-cytochrome b5 reductase 1 [Fulvia fulva]WPV14758.1 NADH-cytochrome b5 reductase 1 [Fulvia fulva]WPV29479.1 NADH-cytochrome b5 reductase 1 [Fulvia fulva]